MLGFGAVGEYSIGEYALGSNFTLPADTGAYTLTGIDTLDHYLLRAAAAAYTLTGTAAAATVGQVIHTASANFLLTFKSFALRWAETADPRPLRIKRSTGRSTYWKGRT